MRLRIFSIVFFLCYFLLPNQVFSAPLAEDIAKAEALVQQAQYTDAFEAFMELVREYPDDFSVNLGAARTAVLANKLPIAHMFYQRLVTTLPDNAVLRVELATLLERMGQHEQAEAELTEARRLDPDMVAATLPRQGDTQQYAVSTLEASFRLTSGYVYDSNINSGPSLRGVMLGSLPIILNTESVAQSASGFYLHATGDVAWRANADTPWWVVGDASGYQRWYDSTSPRRDLTFGRVAAGLRYLSSNFLGEVRLKTDMVLENNKQSSNLYGAESSFIYAMKPQTHLLFRAGLEHREDLNTKGRSGTYTWGGPYLRYYFGTANHSILLGFRGYTAVTNEQRYRYDGIEPSLTVALNLPWESQLIFSGSWHNEDYQGSATIFDTEKRRDQQWRGSIFAIKKITDWLSVELSYQYTDNNSNSDLYTYDQHMITAGMSLSF